MKKARCQDVQTNVDETHWSICTGTERKQEDKPCNGEAVWRKQGGRKKWGKERTNGENVGCEGATQTLVHRHFCTQTLLHTDAFTQRRFNISHTDALTHGRFYTHTTDGLHTDAFTHPGVYTQTTSHWRPYTPALLRTEAFTPRTKQNHLFLQFWRSNLFSCLTVTKGNSKSYFFLSILLQVLTIEPPFVRKWFINVAFSWSLVATAPP